MTARQASVVHGEDSLRKGFMSLALAFLSASAFQPTGANPGARSVQIVYESDTRGYYQPCG